MILRNIRGAVKKITFLADMSVKAFSPPQALTDIMNKNVFFLDLVFFAPAHLQFVFQLFI